MEGRFTKLDAEITKLEKAFDTLEVEIEKIGKEKKEEEVPEKKEEEAEKKEGEELEKKRECLKFVRPVLVKGQCGTIVTLITTANSEEDASIKEDYLKATVHMCKELIQSCAKIVNDFQIPLQESFRLIGNVMSLLELVEMAAKQKLLNGADEVMMMVMLLSEQITREANLLVLKNSKEEERTAAEEFLQSHVRKFP